MKSQTKRPLYCTNCGQYGHYLKSCLAPVTSFGCIIMKLPDGFDQAKELLKNDKSISGLENYMKDIQFLMIQRRDSLGFIEILRGKYKTTDLDYINYHVSTMTKDEQEKVLTQDFDTLWNNLWGTPKEQSQNYKNDREQAKLKFETLISEGTLKNMIESLKNSWDSPEWGFPKGRKDPRETDLQCAFRELREETGITEKDIIFIKNLEPISETFFGSNNVHYCHKYFLCLYNSNKELIYDKTNFHMAQEIGNLGWFTLDDCLNKIRPENIEKKEVLLRAISLIRNYCPLRIL
jgi:8-oxo-dGTP pyrophosphatase MutT (NUDIX family)